MGIRTTQWGCRIKRTCSMGMKGNSNGNKNQTMGKRAIPMGRMKSTKIRNNEYNYNGNEDQIKRDEGWVRMGMKKNLDECTLGVGI